MTQADFPLSAFHVNSLCQTLPYPQAHSQVLSRAAGAQAVETVSHWKGYKKTPMVALDALAASTGVARIHYKHEASRFGLGSFKALGGAYAVLRLLVRLMREKHGPDVGADEILNGTYADDIAKITVCCATDGNHGRSVAWGGQMLGCQVVIFVHATVSQGRADAIAGFGARVIRTAGNYDESVRESARMAAENGWYVVSDTSYPGYTDVPRDVMQGYSVMAEEALAELALPPTHIFLQGGVGGLAAAVTATFWEALGAGRPQMVIVEPDTAACLLASARAGGVVSVTGDLETIMAGLACGEPSLIAWPILRDGAVGFVSIPDETAAQTMRLLASGDAGARIVAGESGVAGLAGFLALSPQAREAFGINETSRILAFGSEGDTDAGVYTGIVGMSGDELRAEGAI